MLKPRPFRIFPAPELLSLPPADYLVEDILEENSLSVMYGPSGAGKSFVAFDMALHIATGRPWADKTVKHGQVIYVAAEGYRVLAERLRAWEKFYKCPAPSMMLVAIEPVNLSGGDASLEQFLVDAVGSAESDFVIRDDEGEIIDEVEAPPIRLVVFDTLARCLFNTDENSAQEMGLVVKWLDKLRDKELTGLETSVMVVHHSAKNIDHERGSSALRGAADTMLYVRHTKDDSGPVLLCHKQKGAAPFDPIDFTIVQMSPREPVLVMREKIDLIAPDRHGPDVPKAMRTIKLGPQQRLLLRVVAEHSGPEGLTVTDIARLAQREVPNVVRAKTALVQYGFLYKEPTAKGYKITRTGLRALEDQRDEPTQLRLADD